MKVLTQLVGRIPGGYYYEHLKYLKKYAPHGDAIMQAYLEYMKDAYWHGGTHCFSNSYFPSDVDKVSFGDVVLPSLSGHAIYAFWCEFPDLLLPYLEGLRGRKYQYDGIDPLMVEGPYEIDERVSVNNGDIVIDCGANIGLFSAVASHEGAKVFAFEPDSNVILQYLSKTAEYNGNITVFPYALSDHNGIEYFNSNSVEIASGKIGTKTQNSVEVDVTTLDEFVEQNNIEHIDFIKADIEGAERLLLQGARNVLKTFAPKLSICTYHLPDDKEVLEAIVKEANPAYHVVHKYLKMYCWVDKD